MYGLPCTDLHLSVHGLKSTCTDIRIPNSVHFCEFPKKNPYIRTSVHTVSPEGILLAGTLLFESGLMISLRKNSEIILYIP